jgi:hypothetical protein
MYFVYKNEKREKGEEMTQTLYAHMNKRKKKNMLRCLQIINKFPSKMAFLLQSYKNIKSYCRNLLGK